MRYYRISQEFSGFSQLHLFNIVLAGLCEAGSLQIATRFLEDATTREVDSGVDPNAVR